MSDQNKADDPVTEPKELYHLIHDKDEEFMARVDKYGGWPLGKKFVSFFHSGPAGPRRCEFGNEYVRSGWWTTVYSADDYYRYKLSPKAIADIKHEARIEIVRQLGGWMS